MQAQWARVRAGPGGPENPGHGVRRQRTVQSGLHAGWCTANVGSNEFCAQQSLVLRLCTAGLGSVHRGRVLCTAGLGSVHSGRVLCTAVLLSASLYQTKHAGVLYKIKPHRFPLFRK